MTRRRFLKTTGTCAGYMAFLSGASPAMMSQVLQDSADREIVAKDKFARIEKVSDGVWAVISTPFESQSFETVCNGGIVAGEKGVLAIETYMNTEGAKWVAEWAERLTGRWPTDAIISHFHSDHSGGRRGYERSDQETRIWTTPWTRENILRQENEQGDPKIDHHRELKTNEAHLIDLGNRKVNVVTRVGHTSSDVTVELEDPNVMFTGDLFFNRMIPNFADSRPEKLSESVAEISRDKETLYVPGHGPIATHEDIDLYREFLDSMREVTEASYEAGKSSEEAAKEFKLPKKFEDWMIFSDAVVPRAFAAWYRQFDGEYDD